MAQGNRRPAQAAKPTPTAPKPTVQIHVHKPGKTIQAAIANAKQHVANVNKAARKKK